MTPKKKKLINMILFGLTCLIILATLSTIRTHSVITSVSWGKWKEHQLWPKDPECQIHRTRIAVVGSIPSRALASYPGSGNTWIRYLIEGGSGVYTGSIFSDSSIAGVGHFGETRDFKDGSTILQKTHHRAIFQPAFANHSLNWRKNHINQFGGRGVIVVRNPFKAVLSYWNFWRTKSHTATVTSGSLGSQQFRDFAFVGIARWFELISDWIEYGSEVYFVFYEDLKDNPVQEIEKLLEYLGLEVDQNRLHCIQKNLAGSFHRTTHDDNNPFSTDHQTLYRSLISLAKDKIFSRTGQILPTQKYEFYNITLN